MKVLVISVHPDDETLGCGGTILRHAGNGDAVHWLIITRPHSPQWSADIIAQKEREVKTVASAYGMQSVQRLDFPTVRLDTVPLAELIPALAAATEKVRPETVYLVHDGDVHTDHHQAFVGIMSVLKTFYMRTHGVQRVLSYETLSSTDAAPPQAGRMFLPAVYHDISPYLERKLEIMALYETEKQDDPMPRGPSAIRALARFRGASIGVEYAEAFMLIREVT